MTGGRVAESSVDRLVRLSSRTADRERGSCETAYVLVVVGIPEEAVVVAWPRGVVVG